MRSGVRSPSAPPIPNLAKTILANGNPRQQFLLLSIPTKRGRKPVSHPSTCKLWRRERKFARREQMTTCIIHANVALGANHRIDDFVIIGAPPRETEPGEIPTSIGPNAIIRSHTVIYA